METLHTGTGSGQQQCAERGCPKPATDRYHKDGNRENNDPHNVVRLCRKHQMVRDGRLAQFVAHSRSFLGPQPAKRCTNCGVPSKPLRKQRCKTCDHYLRQTGFERPYVGDGRSERWQMIREGVTDLLDAMQPRGSRIRRGGGGSA